MIDREDGNSLRAGFLRSSARWSSRSAVIVRGKTLSYSELEETARRWARVLMEACPAPPERVGIFAYRSEVSYAGTLAALFAGATFVPLNPSFPHEKTRAMAERASLSAVIVDKTCMSQMIEVLGGLGIPVILLPDADQEVRIPGVNEAAITQQSLNAAKPLDALPPLTEGDMAYLLYTSGSTGAPKGVPVTHGNAMHFMKVMSERYQLRPEDRISQTFDQTFDLSVFDLFMTWCNGACLYSVTPIELLAPTKFINKNEITVWFTVPSGATQMQRRDTLAANSMPGLRYSLFCGEALRSDTAIQWQQAAPNSIVENLYGPTELTIACFVHRWNPKESPEKCLNGIVPIGRPFADLVVTLVNDKLLPVPDGEPGELCVSGPQTVPGYWNDPGKTAERFVDLPISEVEKRRFYRTGDMVALRIDGEYVYVGRTDQQIKILGHRVELGEIEAALRRGKGVEHAVAFGSPLEGTTAEAVVAVVSGDKINVHELDVIARQCLPPYMVPNRVEILSDMPLNANGKVDRPAVRSRLMSIFSTERSACSASS